MENKINVINLLGGPGSGKSTTFSGIFHYMKLEGISVEMVSEYVKPMAYEKRNIFNDQIYIFAKQYRHMHILDGQIDWIVTDSPLFLSAVYANKNNFEHFIPLVMEAYNTFNNHNIILNRVKDYKKIGRNQDESQAKEIDVRVKNLMIEKNLPFEIFDGDPWAAKNIFKKLFPNSNIEKAGIL